MIFNKQRKAVWMDYGESTCPECGGELIARRPEFRIWHWAHRPESHRSTNCPHEESEWHMAWKLAYLKAGCRIEEPVTIDGKVYRVDVLDKKGHIKEFVHSLSPHYQTKHEHLTQSGLDVMWLFDGSVFVSKLAKLRMTSNNKFYYKHMLKPTAYMAAKYLGTATCHYQEQFFRRSAPNPKFPRGTNTWFEVDSQSATYLLSTWEKVRESIRKGDYQT